MNIEELERVKEQYDKQTVTVKDENGVIIREMTVRVLDNYYDYDKKKSRNIISSTPSDRIRWNGFNAIYEWQTDITNNISVFINANSIELIINKASLNYRIVIENNTLYIKHKNNVDYANIDEIEIIVNKFIDNVFKMDINPAIKVLVFNLINNAKYIYSKNYDGYKKDKLVLEEVQHVL